MIYFNSQIRKNLKSGNKLESDKKIYNIFLVQNFIFSQLYPFWKLLQNLLSMHISQWTLLNHGGIYNQP
jgi:hypothetical protein